MFERAAAKASCIIFIDELDAIGKSRDGGITAGHDEREQTLNQLLAEMDGFDARVGLIILAATNRPEILDPALMRPGRFDRQVLVDRPDKRGREQILRIHVKNVKIGSEVDLSALAARTPDHEKEIVAHHEAGHAVVSWVTSGPRRFYEHLLLRSPLLTPSKPRNSSINRSGTW